ncbi:hypothetical protein Salat_2066000 [Sesamum alatum]|uniref:Uncharacterized protein n=1 Tax=Sesamum alatum TaxID=300844 RepID=A0AAE1XZY2_9LAMI|nr:hypothetical protein Salat_2066000 [Sesamum alatum]
MMEKSQLDFSAPILSIRRFSSDSNSSELPNRQVTEKLRSSRQQSPTDWEHVTVTEPASVPFQWEQVPGRPKCEVQIQVRTSEESSNSGERANINRPQIEAFLFGDHATLLEELRESLNCRDESGTVSDGDAYSNALQTESWSLNFSVSGLSGYQSSGVKPSGTFSVDRQTRDFMMDRFLPAAKAVVLEFPNYVVKKPRVVNEQPKPVKKVIPGDRKRLLGYSGSYPLQYYIQYAGNVQREDGAHKYTFPVKKSGKCRLIIPLFCAKDSSCLLSTSSGMKLKFQGPTSSAADARRLTRNGHCRPSDKNNSPVLHKRKSNSGLLSRDQPEIKNKLTGNANQLNSSRIANESGGLSPFRRYRSSSISPSRSKSQNSPSLDDVHKKVANYTANKIASSRKFLEFLQDVSRNQLNERGSGPRGDAVEKTVYIDCPSKTDQDTSCPNTLEEGKKLSHHRLDQESRALEFTGKLPSDTKSGMKDTDPHPLKPHFPPPLPKSPSESWLWRTAPSIYSGNPFSKSQNGMIRKKRDQKGYITGAKWESIVKTSNLRHDDVRRSEGASACLLK